MKICVIGMGHIGNLHADIYKENKLVKLAGVCDILNKKAEEAGKRLGVPWYTNAEEMLDEVKPDLCSVTTGGFEYGSDHYEPTMQALNANCHVLCEKPICNEIKPAEEMVYYAKKKNLCLAVNFNHRFTPAARLAKKWQTDGLIGELLFVNMSLWIGKFKRVDSPYYHLKALNPHSIDMIRYFCGEIARVQCFAMKAKGRIIWSTASINMQFANKAVGHLTSSYDIERGHPMERCEVAGTKGRMVIDDIWKEATLYPAGNLEKRVYTNPVFGGFKDFEDTFRSRINTFIKQVNDGVKPDNIDGTGADALEAQKIIQAAITSLELGRVIDVMRELK